MKLLTKILLILALMSTPAHAANLFVPDEHPTIQAAVDAASPGDRILVGPGNYAGARIDKWVKISGVGDATVINQGIGSGFRHFGFELRTGADMTRISDLAMDFPPPSPTGVSEGVNVSFALGPPPVRITIRNVKFIGLTRGIRVRDSSGWIITDNVVDGLRAPGPFSLVAAGIWLSGTGGSLIANNSISHNEMDLFGKVYVGINLSASPFTGQTENNKVINNTVSIQADGASKFSDIELFTGAADCVGPLLIFDNKVVQNDADVSLTPPCLAEHNVIR